MDNKFPYKDFDETVRKVPLTAFEVGYLWGLLQKNLLTEELPVPLQQKFQLWMTATYLNHNEAGEHANKEALELLTKLEGSHVRSQTSQLEVDEQGGQEVVDVDRGKEDQRETGETRRVQ